MNSQVSSNRYTAAEIKTANIGYILGDRDMLAVAKAWTDGVLRSQHADGNFGPIAVDDKGVEDFQVKMSNGERQFLELMRSRQLRQGLNIRIYGYLIGTPV